MQGGHLKMNYMKVLSALSLLWMFIFSFFPACVSSQVLTLDIGSSYFMPMDGLFQDIYGQGFFHKLGLEFHFSSRYSVWMRAGYFPKTGATSFTHDETRLRLLHLQVGGRTYRPFGSVIPYGSAGVHMVSYQETNPIGRVDGIRVGGTGEAGVLFKVQRWLFLDGRAGYTYCPAQSVHGTVNLGGFGMTVGFKIRLPIRFRSADRPWYETLLEAIPNPGTGRYWLH